MSHLDRRHEVPCEVHTGIEHQHDNIATLHDSPACTPMYEQIKAEKAWRMYMLLICSRNTAMP